MGLLEQFERVVTEENLFSKKERLLLAVSGGVDSVVLCELCSQGGYDFMIAHCNFRLRGEESERDETFVKQLGINYGVRVLVERFDTAGYAVQNKLSIQEAARELRYNWFNRLLMPDSGFSTLDHVITAHHADDNAETLLMNFCRGTGLHGLTGIPLVSGNTRRPLLSFPKELLVSFARENNLSFVEDSSNLSTKYTRNLFRNEIIPAIAKVYPQVKENLLDNISRFKAIEQLYRHAIDEIIKKLCRQKGGEIHIPVKQLMGFDNRALIYEIISKHGFTEKQVDEVIKLAGSESGKYIGSPGNDWRIIRHRHWFIITRVHSVESENIIIEQGDSAVLMDGYALKFELMPVSKLVKHSSPVNTGKPTPEAQVPSSVNIACIDTAKVEFPLLLRKWKVGDYFYPLGMKKKKKIARFFIDQKLSKTQKENVWVLEMNKKIIWVVGYRIDDRFKVTEQTKEVLVITFGPLHYH
ncbi:MAG TPA: tRNA lysidine(34) synthetase TilS [Chitinophagaceae bacterium]|nr:tRNA lysidine(34) synthetase TilS [Chitinophagaceae bacterium]